jgi:hypothetical protein
MCTQGWGSDAERRNGATWNTSSDWNQSTSAYSYGNIATMQPTVAKCCKSAKQKANPEQHIVLPIYCTELTSAFPLTCTDVLPTCHSLAAVMASKAARTLRGNGVILLGFCAHAWIYRLHFTALCRRLCKSALYTMVSFTTSVSSRTCSSFITTSLTLRSYSLLSCHLVNTDAALHLW